MNPLISRANISQISPTNISREYLAQISRANISRISRANISREYLARISRNICANISREYHAQISCAQIVVYKCIVGQMLNILDYNIKSRLTRSQNELFFLEYIYDDYFCVVGVMLYLATIFWVGADISWRNNIDFVEALLLLHADAMNNNRSVLKKSSGFHKFQSAKFEYFLNYRLYFSFSCWYLHSAARAPLHSRSW